MMLLKNKKLQKKVEIKQIEDEKFNNNNDDNKDFDNKDNKKNKNKSSGSNQQLSLEDMINERRRILYGKSNKNVTKYKKTK